METLQKLVPFFQDLLRQWYQFTLDNADYAGALAVSVWLLTAIFYSIRIGFLKRQIARAEKAKNETLASLNAAEQQCQALQQQMSETTEKMQSAVETAESQSQRASSLEQRLNTSNQKLANSLANLVDSFELNLHSLPAADAENLLSEYDAVVARVAERFQNEQQAKTQLQLTLHAEAAKLAEKEMLASSLQHRLDTQTQQLAKLEMAVEQYEAAQRQLEADKEQQLAEAMARQQAEAARLAELEKQRQAETHIPPQTSAIAQEAQKPAEPVKQPEVIEKTVQAASVVVEPQLNSESIATKAPEVEKTGVKAPTPSADTKKPKAVAADKGKGLFGRAMDRFAKLDQKLGFQTKTEIEPEKPALEDEKIIEARQTDSAAQEAVAEPIKVAKESASLGKKMGGLLGGFKKSPANEPLKNTAPQQPETPAAVVEPLPEAAAAENNDKPGNKATNKLAGMFGKFKSKK